MEPLQGTCDDLIWESVSSKMRIVGRALDGKTVSLNAAEREEDNLK